MKARIKKTGEIVNIAEYAKITLEQCDSWGNPIEVKPEEVELIDDETAELELYEQWGKESPLQDYWQDVRERAAIVAMQGTISILGSSDRTAFRDIVVEGFRGDKKTYPNEIAEFAVACADALIDKLKNK
jgi:hypothetical protein